MDMAYNPSYYERGHNWGGYVDERSSFDIQPYNLYRSVRRNLKGKPADIAKDDSKEALQLNARNQIQGLQGQLFTETIRSFDAVLYYLFPKMLGLVERAWNAESPWMQTQATEDYIESINLFNAKISRHELPRLHQLNANFRLSEPGLKIINGQLYANSRIAGATIRFTTDGSEPSRYSTEWITPIPCNAPIIKAKAFYLGKESATVLLPNKN
jgi:hexosaminidase